LKSDKDRVLRQAGQALLRNKPLLEKLCIGLKMEASAFGNEGVETGETEDCFIWKVNRCPNCWGWKAEEPVCFSWIGFLQAELRLELGIQDIQIIEKECRAMGAAACTFEIYKSSIKLD
jgi:predicted hydrocarbon binding protein